MISGNLSSIPYEIPQESTITNDILEAEKIENKQFLEVSLYN